MMMMGTSLRVADSSLLSERMKYSVLPALVVLLGSCAGSEVTQIGPPRPSKPVGCPVEIFAGTMPTYAYVDIASVQTRCHHSYGRKACLENLRSKACALGGDTVYGFAQGQTRDYSLIAATVAVRSVVAEARLVS